MKKRILIADDEQAECVLLSLALKKEYDISIVNTAADCLHAVRNTTIDVVLLDLVFGPSNGLTVLKEIKSISEDTIVIMITAFGSIKSSVEAMSLGAFTYLTKPIEVDELKESSGELTVSYEDDECSLNFAIRYAMNEDDCNAAYDEFKADKDAEKFNFADYNMKVEYDEYCVAQL